MNQVCLDVIPCHQVNRIFQVFDFHHSLDGIRMARFALGFSIQGGNPDTGESINEEIFDGGFDNTISELFFFSTIISKILSKIE